MDRLRRDGRAPCWAAARSCWPGLVYVFGLEHYRPILRSTILTAFLGYSLLIVALLIDVGRPQNILLARRCIYHNIHSVLWEVAMCVMCYTTVLALEFAAGTVRAAALATGLADHPQDHAAAGHRRHPALHHAPVVAGLAVADRARQAERSLVHALAAGLLLDLGDRGGVGMVMVESNLSCAGFKRGLEQNLLAQPGEGLRIFWLFYAIFKMVDVVARGQAALLTAADTASRALLGRDGAVRHRAGHPAVAAEDARSTATALFAAGGMVVCGGILNRLNVSIFGLWSYTGPIYFPSWMEIVLTTALFTFLAAAFVVRRSTCRSSPRSVKSSSKRCRSRRRSKKDRPRRHGGHRARPKRVSVHLRASVAHHLFSVAVSTISGTAASAFDTGQLAFAWAANSWKVASSTPGTSASQFSSILLIVGPAVRCTVAVV